jgi:hypothetical protein
MRTVRPIQGVEQTLGGSRPIALHCALEISTLPRPSKIKDLHETGAAIGASCPSEHQLDVQY